MDPYLPLISKALEAGVGMVALLAGVAFVGFFVLRVYPQTVKAMADAGQAMAGQARRDRKLLRAWMAKQDERHATQERADADRHAELLGAVRRSPTDPEGRR